MTREFLKTKESITAWLYQYKVKNYILVEDPIYGYGVDVHSSVYLSDQNLYFIPVKFHSVFGSFYCQNNQLTSLEFSPELVEHSFVCSYNKLTSLEFCPKNINGSFWCQNNELTSLEFFPQKVNEEFVCLGNKDLGSLQDIADFDLLYQEHLRIVNIKKEKELLGALVKAQPDIIKITNNNSNSFKV